MKLELITDTKVTEMTKKKNWYSRSRQWYGRSIKRCYYHTGQPFYTPELEANQPFLLECSHCSAHYVINKCDNCNNWYGFQTGEGDAGLGLVCCYCENGISQWTCAKCNTNNSVAKTLFVLETLCIVATVAYGSAFAPEVALLRQFRDEKLLKSRVGQWFVEIYYCLSPPIAIVISQYELLKTMVKRLVLKPILYFLKCRKPY